MKEVYPAGLAGELHEAHDRILELERRLKSAEMVCSLFGITGVRYETDRDYAVAQAWSEWYDGYGQDTPLASDDMIASFALRRRESRQRALDTIRERFPELVGNKIAPPQPDEDL